MFQHATAALRYDPTERKAKMSAFAAAAQRLAEGEAPESVGLPNVGIPREPPVINESKSSPAGSTGRDLEP